MRQTPSRGCKSASRKEVMGFYLDSEGVVGRRGRKEWTCFFFNSREEHHNLKQTRVQLHFSEDVENSSTTTKSWMECSSAVGLVSFPRVRRNIDTHVFFVANVASSEQKRPSWPNPRGRSRCSLRFWLVTCPSRDGRGESGNTSAKTHLPTIRPARTCLKSVGTVGKLCAEGGQESAPWTALTVVPLLCEREVASDVFRIKVENAPSRPGRKSRSEGLQ